MTNPTQSQQYIMDLIDQKFEKLKDSVYKLGIQPVQFRNMVEGQSLFEWSPEVCLAMSTRFCSWIVPETEAEHQNEDTEDTKSLNTGRQESMMQNMGDSRHSSTIRGVSLAKIKAESPLPRSNYEPNRLEPESPGLESNSLDESGEQELPEKVERNETSEEDFPGTPVFLSLQTGNDQQ